MAIRWKVVKKNNRKSYIVNTNKYAQTYTKDSIVTASLNTLGLMTFKTKKSALLFINTISLHPFILLRVKGIGRGKVPRKVSTCASKGYLDEFYKLCEKDQKYTISPPDGTICYQQVYVID